MSAADGSGGSPEILTLRAYFAERERIGSRFLAEALLDLCVERSIATAVMHRGIAGFGPANVTRSDRTLSSSEDPPVTIAAVDTAERITALAGEVAALLSRGLLTVEGSDRGVVAPVPRDDTVRLTLDVGRRHRIAGVPAYVAVCAVLHRHGFAGADVYLGVDGAVAGARHRARFFSRNGDIPLSIVGIGTRGRAAAAADEIRALLPDALFTVGSARVCKADGHAVGLPRAVDGPFQKLTVHTSEASRYQGVPIHRALLQRLKGSDHAGGASVLRAIWGFRGTEPPHGDRFLQLARRVPVTTVLIDSASNVAASYAVVDELTEHQGLVTVEPLRGLLQVEGGQRLGSLDPGGAGNP